MLDPTLDTMLLVGGLAEPDGEVAARAARLAQVLVPGDARLRAVSWVEAPTWLSFGGWERMDRALAGAERTLEALSGLLTPGGRPLAGEVVSSDELDGVLDASLAHLGLVLLASHTVEGPARRWVDLVVGRGRPVAWGVPRTSEPARRVFVVGDAVASALSAASFLRRGLHADARMTVCQIASAPGPARPDADTLRALIGWPGALELDALTASPLHLPAAVGERLAGVDADLVVVADLGLGGLARAALMRMLDHTLGDRAIPRALVPGSPLAIGGRELVVADGVVDARGRVAFAVRAVDLLGHAAPAGDAPIAVVHDGRVWVTAADPMGRIELEAPATEFVAMGEVDADAEGDRLLNTRALARLLRPRRPLALFDVGARAPVKAYLDRHGPGGLEWWAVHLDAEVSSARHRGDEEGWPGPLIDASAVLDDQDGVDLPDAARAVRLSRVARHLRLGGVDVALVVGAEGAAGHTGLPVEALDAPDAASALADRVSGAHTPPLEGGDPVWRALRTLTTGHATRAQSVRLIWENGEARRRLLASIDGAEARLDLQTYIWEPDALGDEVLAACRRAAERGVRVRLLVDTLINGSSLFGRAHEGLRGLRPTPNLALRWARPLPALPGIDELKCRDHRKLLLVDDRLAVVSGRNLGAPYFRGFDELRLTPESPSEEVPWVDLSVELTGPAVRSLGANFDEAFRAAETGGGERGAEPAGERGAGEAGEGAAVFLVNHRGTRDTETLDTYRALIDFATERVWVVNTFPLQRELVAALRRAVRRGVEVRLLLGNVRPLQGDRRPFPGGVIRDLATAVIHGRVDPLVVEGVQVAEWVEPPPEGAGWTVGAIRPHVHTKLVCVDGRFCTVGSANLDATAGYWEDELLLVFDDQEVAAAAEAELSAAFARAARVEPDDPEWQQRAARRAWIARRWPSLLGA